MRRLTARLTRYMRYLTPDGRAHAPCPKLVRELKQDADPHGFQAKEPRRTLSATLNSPDAVKSR
jgi:hypothetical protein